MNGSDKNVGSIEKLIEELTKVRPDELSKDGLKLFEYINEIIDRNKELEEKWDKDTHKLQNALDLANADKINNYIPKQRIIDETIRVKNKPLENRFYNSSEVKLFAFTVLDNLLEKRK